MEECTWRAAVPSLTCSSGSPCRMPAAHPGARAACLQRVSGRFLRITLNSICLLVLPQYLNLRGPHLRWASLPWSQRPWRAARWDVCQQGLFPEPLQLPRACGVAICLHSGEKGLRVSGFWGFQTSPARLPSVLFASTSRAVATRPALSVSLAVPGSAPHTVGAQAEPRFLCLHESLPSVLGCREQGGGRGSSTPCARCLPCDNCICSAAGPRES